MRMRPDKADQPPDQPAAVRMPVLAVPVLAMIVILVVLVIVVLVLVVRVIVVVRVVSAHACQHARPGRAWSSGLVLAVDEYLRMA